MENINTVTISVDEYFELRQKAAMNEFLVKEFGIIDARLSSLETKCDDITWDIKLLKKDV